MPTKSQAASLKPKHADEAAPRKLAALAEADLLQRKNSAGVDGPDFAAIRSGTESLTGDAGEAKPKTATAAADSDLPARRSEEVAIVGTTRSRPAGKASRSTGQAEAATAADTMAVNAGATRIKGGAVRADPLRVDPLASRKAAAAFVAARKKMAPATPSASSATHSIEASKGTVQVSDRKMRKTIGDETSTPIVASVTPAPEPAAVVAAPEVRTGGFVPAARGPAAPSAAKPKATGGPKEQGFKTGEYIVYPAHGVGQITAVEEQEVAGYKLELFVISFVKDKMILKVPLPKIASVGMRKLAGPQVMKRALDTLTGRARVKRTMWSRRAQEYEAKINSGDLVSIAEVVRDLYRSDAQPEQSYSERQLYEAALDRMAREIAVVQALTDTEALKLIDDQLQKGPRRGKAEEGEGEDAEEADDAGGLGEAA